MVQTHAIPAISMTATVLHTLVEQYWLMPPALATATLDALMRSTYSRPVTLKRHLAIATTMRTDLDAFFDAVCTPAFCVQMLEDVCLEGLLTRPQASAAQRHVLARANKDGKWKTEHAG